MNLRETCPTCRGRGHWLEGAFGTCKTCDGLGTVYVAGAPAFGCSMALGSRAPGEIVLLGTGERAKIMWHSPKPTKKRPADVTFVGLIDDFDDHESTTPTMYPAELGIREVITDDTIVGRSLQSEDHAGEKDADELDPMAARARHGALL